MRSGAVKRRANVGENDVNPLLLGRVFYIYISNLFGICVCVCVFME